MIDHRKRLLQGDVYLATHRASVISILGSKAPRVCSHGERFFNYDRWTLRSFVQHLFRWVRSNPSEVLDESSLAEVLAAVNQEVCSDPRIVIASTPSNLPPALAQALIGGAYHEAWHTLYDRRSPILLSEVSQPILTRADLFSNGSLYEQFLTEWLELLMDIRIERLGGFQFPATRPRLIALQELILEQERIQRRGGQSLGFLGVLHCTFRETGLGYVSEAVRGALETYRHENASAFEIVVRGPLRPLLDRATKPRVRDDLEPLFLSLEIASTLSTVLDLRTLLTEAYEEDQNSEDRVRPTDLMEKEGVGSVEASIRFLDSSRALEKGVSSLFAEKEKNLKEGEKVWRPYRQDLDEVLLVKPSSYGKEHDDAIVRRVLHTVRQETCYYRARLYSVIRGLEEVSKEHGSPYGNEISDQYLIETVCSLREGFYPRRAFVVDGQQMETSTAVAIVLDQSISMIGRLGLVTALLVSLTEPFDTLGCAVQVSGFRDGTECPESPDLPKSGGMFHRVHGVDQDLYKLFDEPFKQVRWRFARTRCGGQTPMADGIQFALEGLQRRPEKNKLLFVITDGLPDESHEPVVKYQLRVSRRRSVHVIGVGIGKGAEYVRGLFREAVWSEKMHDLPSLLVKKLTDVHRYFAPVRRRNV